MPTALPVNLRRRPLLMAVLNITPDSFSGDGCLDMQALLDRAETAISNGADILDLGAESTRPGAIPITPEEEWQRLAPALSAIRQLTSLPLSIDTRNSTVARQALASGGTIINDISGGRHDPAILAVAAAARCPIILTHNSITNTLEVGEHWHAHGAQQFDHITDSVSSSLTVLRDTAISAGIDAADIWLDPGIGFGKNLSDTLTLLRHLGDLRRLGQRLAVGVSNKSFIGQLSGRPVAQRQGGSAAAVALAVAAGADILRVHDTATMRQVIDTAAAITYGLAG